MPDGLGRSGHYRVNVSSGWTKGTPHFSSHFGSKVVAKIKRETISKGGGEIFDLGVCVINAYLTFCEERERLRNKICCGSHSPPFSTSSSSPRRESEHFQKP